MHRKVPLGIVPFSSADCTPVVEYVSDKHLVPWGKRPHPSLPDNVQEASQQGIAMASQSQKLDRTFVLRLDEIQSHLASVPDLSILAL